MRRASRQAEASRASMASGSTRSDTWERSVRRAYARGDVRSAWRFRSRRVPIRARSYLFIRAESGTQSHRCDSRSGAACRCRSDGADIAAAVREAAAVGYPLRIVGAGTWLDAGGSVTRGARPAHRGDTGIVAYVPGDLTITMRAGTTLEEIDGRSARARPVARARPSGRRDHRCDGRDLFLRASARHSSVRRATRYSA